MTDVIKKGLLTLMSDKCYDNYFVDFNFMHGKKKIYVDYLYGLLIVFYLFIFSS